ncbi:hypothetical protein LZ24_00743 [Desulfobotulus alkaliphilus]|uniref:Uncharacterized protein n=1 Tax=Desulfobotulus alkaliphilus TaxID=622671 RepID=A0A562S1X2_9BACT|nr:hypothetical protein [Desulfobotulus alkaliphilus]TWI75292.1 hypothetical protein LZ24_00743 [Desulfobotulus alkaliphilus]
MEIIIGKTAESSSAGHRGHPRLQQGDVPVKVLKVRPARSRRSTLLQGKDRRDENVNTDPMRGKVLVLMVPDGSRLPPDLETGEYQLRLRIVSDKTVETPKATTGNKEDSGLNIRA